MPVTDVYLSDIFIGSVVRKEKMKAAGWVYQGGPNAHFGFPRKKNLWLKKYLPEEGCCHRTIWIFVLVNLGSGDKISKIEVATSDVHADGSFTDMEMPLIHPQTTIVSSDIIGILDDNSLKAIKKKDEKINKIPLDVLELAAIVDKSVGDTAVKKIIDRYGLVHSPAFMASGKTYTVRNKRLEFETDALGCIKTVWINRLGGEDNVFGLTCGAKRSSIRKELGRPTKSAEDGWWDRFDSKTRAVHIQYNSDGSVAKITIMSPSVAP